jgi:hypothetical protein
MMTGTCKTPQVHQDQWIQQEGKHYSMVLEVVPVFHVLIVVVDQNRASSEILKPADHTKYYA